MAPFCKISAKYWGGGRNHIPATPLQILGGQHPPRPPPGSYAPGYFNCLPGDVIPGETIPPIGGQEADNAGICRGGKDDWEPRRSCSMCIGGKLPPSVIGMKR